MATLQAPPWRSRDVYYLIAPEMLDLRELIRAPEMFDPRYKSPEPLELL